MRKKVHTPLASIRAAVTLHWLACVGAYTFFVIGGIWVLCATPFIIILYHSGHEAIHNALLPRRRGHNVLAGCLAYAVVGHNFFLVRRSHIAHHNCGRAHKHCTIDGSLSGRLISRVLYFLALFGLGQFIHEVAGYLYLLFPAKKVPFAVRFDPSRQGRIKYWAVQVLVLSVTIMSLSRGGIWYLLVRLIYAAYWGFTQNVAHYGLEFEESDLSRVAARSYRVNRFANFLLFGAVFYHLEHHVMPLVPGGNLGDSSVLGKVSERLGCSPQPVCGLRLYLRDLVRQIKGPTNSTIDPREWLT